METQPATIDYVRKVKKEEILTAIWKGTNEADFDAKRCGLPTWAVWLRMETSPGGVRG